MIHFHKYKLIDYVERHVPDINNKEIIFVLDCEKCHKKKLVSRLLLNGSAERFANRYGWKLRGNEND